MGEREIVCILFSSTPILSCRLPYIVYSPHVAISLPKRREFGVLGRSLGRIDSGSLMIYIFLYYIRVVVLLERVEEIGVSL